MTINLPKKKLLSLIAVVVILLLVAGGWGMKHFNSTDYQIQQATKALKNNDYDAFKAICPKFSDDKDIDKEMFELFRTSFPKTISESAVSERLLDSQAFKKQNDQSWFKKTTFTAKPRYVSLETAEADIKVVASAKKQLLDPKKGKIGPFLPGKYELSLAINSPIFGKTQLDKQENLLKEDAQEEIVEEELYLKQADFQKNLLNQVANYYTSYNECLENDLKFSNLSPSTEENTAALQTTYEFLRPLLQQVEQEFQCFVMNPDSLKIISGGSEPVLTFDLYMDQRFTVKYAKELNIGQDGVDESRNSVITMCFDADQKQWLVDDVDSETFNQDPKDWANKQEIKLKEPNKAVWSADKAKSAI